MFEKDEVRFGRFLVPTALVGHSGPLIVGVNGAQQTMGAWRSFVRHFSSRGFRVVLFDFPGQGRGRVLEGPQALDLGEQVAVTAAVLDHVSPEAPVDLIGGSWGAVLCAATAARHPRRVRQMLLGSFRTSANPALLEMARAGRRYVEEGRPERLAELFVEGFGARLPQAKKDQIRRQMRGLAPDQARHLYALSMLFADGADIARHVDLGQVRARTLILNGGADPIVDEENLHCAVRRIPDCVGYLVPDVGHFLHEECPSLLATYEAFFRGARFLPLPGPAGGARTAAEVRTLVPAACA
jgi:pimeloyl-ACP methyl ester carboxylesterase